VSTAHASGRYQRELVYCHRRLASVPVARCQTCQHRQASTANEVVCETASQEPEPAASFTLPRLAVGQVMRRDVLCVRPDLSLDAAALLLLEHPHRMLPVVDVHNHVLGLLDESDLHLEVQSGRGDDRNVASVMAPHALSIPEAMPVTRAAAIMAFEGVSCLVVVAPAGDVVGLLSASDLLFWLARGDGYLTRVRRSELP
jgi:CBS-domain-containing membrane protein